MSDVIEDIGRYSAARCPLDSMSMTLSVPVRTLCTHCVFCVTMAWAMRRCRPSIYRTVVAAKLLYAVSACKGSMLSSGEVVEVASFRQIYRSLQIYAGQQMRTCLIVSSQTRNTCCTNYCHRLLLHYKSYNLRNRKHNLKLPTKISQLTNCNFIQRMLFLNIY